MAERQQTGNKYSRRLPAFIKMNDSMYEEQEVKEQEANFKQKFKQLLLNIGHKISEWYNNCISSIKNCSCSSKESVNSNNDLKISS